MSRLRHRLTIKVIALGTVTGLIAVVVLSLLGIHTARVGIETHTRLHMESVAELKADALQAWSDTLLENASGYVETHSSEDTSESTGLPWRGLMVIEPSDGFVRNSYGSIPNSIDEPATIARSTAPGKYISLANEENAPGYILVAQNRRELGGILVVVANASELVTVLEPDSGLGLTGEVRLTDPERDVTWKVDAVSAQIALPPTAAGKVEGEFIDLQQGGADDLMGVPFRVAGSSLWTTAAISRSAAFADLSRLQWWIVGGGLVSMTITLSLSAVLGRGLTAPLRRLTEGISQFRLNEAPYEVPVTTEDEIGELTKAFNRMSTDLHGASAELVRTNEELVAANEAKNQFLSTVTHELKTPLTSVIAFADLLKRKADSFTERQLTQVEAIKRNARQLEMLINDLLDISRIQSGSLKLNVETCRLSELVEHVVDSMRPIYDEKSQELTVMMDSGDAVISCDKGRMTQVLTNLLSNASKYSPEGSRVDLKLRAEARSILVSVRDQGIGISKADQQKLFTPFYRVENVQTRSIQGTGLGLVIAKRLTELHGGELRVESRVAEGSEFTVMLPRLAA